MNKILRHEYFVWIHCLTQQVLIHVGDGLFTQVMAMTQAQSAALELCRTAFQQHLTKQAHSVGIALCLKHTNIKHYLNLADFIPSFRFPPAQMFFEPRFIQVDHLFSSLEVLLNGSYIPTLYRVVKSGNGISPMKCFFGR